jgi:glycyl-tRNA synthetase beta chain
MSDFLLELLSEEVPARMQAKASADLARLFAEEIARSGLAAQAIETHATPRRLALIARGLPAGTKAVSEELKGPRTSAPPQALEGFLRKTGLSRDQLAERDGIWFATIEKSGRATADVLAKAIPAIVGAFPWPKSMRWGAASASTESLRWVRPLQNIVALLGDEVVEFEIAGVRSGAATVGHRFHHPGIITIGSANDYAEKLRACHVILDAAERRRIIAEGAARAAADAGLTLIEDEGLLAENAGLTEWPMPLLGGFDPTFLDVPREVIQLTMRTNQKYFALTDAAGALAPNFVCVANIEASDGGAAIVAGNERVLSARLSDAKFFWEQDRKVPLEEQAAKLGQIVFHEKLGTIADKVDRVAKLARWLVEENVIPAKAGISLPEGNEIPASAGMTKEALANAAERAARLAKADLVTSMVGEFPELQGVIGGHLARAQGEPDEVADAVRDHYGVNAGGSVALALSLADKLDMVISFFSIGEKPTGSRDPFALRRAGLGAMYLILARQIRLDLNRIAPRDVIEFLVDRWKFQNREAGGRPDLIDAVVAVSSDGDLCRLGMRMRALQSFVETPEGIDLLAGYKRAANILKKEGWPPKDRHPGLDPGSTSSSAASDEERWMPDRARHDEVGGKGGEKPLSYTPLPEEASLIAALDSAEPRARTAVEAEDFEGAMAALASLRAPVDAFFDKVTVNDPDPTKRAARLDLLARMRDAVHQVADFSRIEG